MAGAPAPEEPGNAGLRAFRGALLHFIGDPADAGEHAYEYFEDGLLVVDGGHVVGAGEATAALARLPAGTPVVDRTGKLIVPGFVDTHIHYPQTDMIAAYGEQLLEWLERYTYPAERRFADAAHAHEVAEFFLDELLRNGTTTALVYATVHPQSADAFFAAAQARGARMIAGKVLMDRNCPEFLRDTAESGHADSKALIARWHGKARLSYAVTPRFAPTSTERQLELAGRLLDEHPDVYLQTHVAENRNEVAWAAELFPWSRSYLDVYDRFGLRPARAPSSRTASISTMPIAHGWVPPAPRWRSVRHRTSSSAAVCSISTPRAATAFASASAPTSAPAPRSRSCARSTRPTRSRSSRASGCRRCRRSISPRWAARARFISTIASAISCPARKRISS